jgi:hypothetical protein
MKESPTPDEIAAYRTLFPADIPMIKKIRNITRNRKNRNFAIPAAATAMPVNPKSPAISAIIRKVIAQFNILISSSTIYRMTMAFRV